MLCCNQKLGSSISEDQVQRFPEIFDIFVQNFKIHSFINIHVHTYIIFNFCKLLLCQIHCGVCFTGCNWFICSIWKLVRHPNTCPLCKSSPSIWFYVACELKMLFKVFKWLWKKIPEYLWNTKVIWNSNFVV